MEETDYGEVNLDAGLRRLTLEHLENVNINHILTNLCQLSSLRINDIKLTKDQFDALVHKFSEWEGFQHLAIENCEFEEQGPFIELAKVLSNKHKATLTHLSIGKNHIEEETLENMFSQLADCVALEHLDLTSMRTL